MLADLFQNKEFFRRLLTLATPIAIQNLITFSLGAVDMVMIGQLGDKAVAAVGLADQVFFLVILMMFGIASGAAVFTAQYWGKQDLAGIHRVLSLCLLMGGLGSLIFLGAAVFAPEGVLSIYTTDAEVIALGSEYLRVVGWSYLATAVAVSYVFLLRSVESVKLPMVVGAIVLIFNTTFNYLLIFGHFGFPELGVTGAAIATCLARFLEPIILVAFVYRHNLALAAPLRVLLKIDWQFLPKFLKTALPVVLTEVAWSLGITTYAIIYARISTESIAAVNIVITIERMAFVVFLAMANASAIMIGNRIGAGDIEQAVLYAKRFLILGLLGSIPIGLLEVSAGIPFLRVYQISETVTDYATILLILAALVLPFKVSALMLFIGVLRSGGDTRFSMFVDGGTIWLVGVPLAWLGAFVLGLPVYWVYLMVVTEELVKVSIALRRFFTGTWIHHLAEPEPVRVG